MLYQVLKEMDPEVTRENIQKFIQTTREVLRHLQIDDPMTDIVNTLAKIEARLNYLCEARNILAKQDEKKTAAQRAQPMDLDAFEKDLEKRRREQRNKDQKEKIKKGDQDKKLAQEEKAKRMQEQNRFQGHPHFPRSQKKAMQARVVKKNIMDEATRDEKEYLGTELFQTLQQYKVMEQVQAEAENSVDQVSHMMPPTPQQKLGLQAQAQNSGTALYD